MLSGEEMGIGESRCIFSLLTLLFRCHQVWARAVNHGWPASQFKPSPLAHPLQVSTDQGRDSRCPMLWGGGGLQR